MAMTNYMELLMTNQPWNLILFMVIPVGLAEALVATEFYTLYRKNDPGSSWHIWNRMLGMAAGIYFAGVFLYLTTHVVPHIEWRGWVDMVAVGAYLCGIFPLLSITLLEFGAWGRNLTESQRTHRHFMLLIGFLVVSHVAMVFGMVDPNIAGWNHASHHEMHMTDDAGGHHGHHEHQ